MSSPHNPPSILSLVSLGTKIIFAAIFRLVTAPVRSFNWTGAPNLYKDVFFTAVRTMLANITIAQYRYLFKSTTGAYLELCKNVDEPPKTLHVGEKSPVAAHWIGSEDADVIIFYLHGGGYTQPCTIEHMEYLHRLVKDLNNPENGMPSVSLLFPAYTLAPEASFPTQLKEAAAVLSYLLTQGGKSPAKILLGGDSAGAGLALSLLSHLLHPHLDVPKVPIFGPLRGAFLYSPWVSFSTTFESFTKNAGKDTLAANMLRKWAGMYLGKADGEKDLGCVTDGNTYSEPLLANPSWWEGLHNVVEKIWLFGGQDEVFIDSIREFSEKLGEGWKAGGASEESLTLEFVKDSAHIGPIMDVMLKYTEKSKTQLGLEEWLRERLK